MPGIGEEQRHDKSQTNGGDVERKPTAAQRAAGRVAAWRSVNLFSMLQSTLSGVDRQRVNQRRRSQVIQAVADGRT